MARELSRYRLKIDSAGEKIWTYVMRPAAGILALSIAVLHMTGGV